MDGEVLYTDRLMLSVSEVALYLGLSRRTIERAIADGWLPSTTLRRRRLIPREAVDELLTRAYERRIR